ncbi:mucin-2 [Pelecanus crispus]|uniref:mucin-2 n=1 Tax=Pelecanus crispus TaxID=36300 RepID=UPI003F5D4137
MGLRVASLFMLWLALSYANEIRKGRTRSHGHYVCSTWGNNHFKTFDGDIYQFPGICEYNFASDCRDAYKEFSVHIQRGLNSNNHPEIQYILITIKDFTVYLTPKLAVVDGRIVKTPYYSSVVLIESNDIYTKVYAKLGLILIWNQEDALMVELDSKFNNHTCGLCGDYNGVPIYNEFIDGVVSYNSITYGNLQKISKPNAKCEDPDETQALPSCNGHRDECERLLTSSAFADCWLRLNLEMYIQACMQDKCACNGNEDSFCLCSTISEYSRQCSHAGGRPTEWRTQYFCPKTCPDTMIYRESSSPCMDTCSHLEISSLCEEHYMDGCFCPEGTVYDDITEKGCIPASQCHCKLHGKEYPPGENITNECEECTCDSGRWMCKDLPCPGTCSVEGGSHITTFDGKKYTFHGDCYYVLAKGTVNDSHALLAELAPCGSTDRQTCLKTVVLLVDHKKNVVVFRSDGSVLLNELTVNVPYVSASFSVFKPSSYYLVVQTSFGLQLQIQLFPVMQLFATVDQSVQGKLQGLCGNFNGMEGDDFKTTSGLVEATGSAFANTWKAQSTCTDQVEKLENPCSLSIESANYAEHWCSLLKNSEGPFARCHPIIDPSEYYKKCKYDTCLCEDNEECLCAALSSYSRACAFKGIILGGWRKSVCSNEVSSCPGNQIFLYNLTMCQQTCRSLADGEKHCLQDFAPVDGCGCPYNTYLDNQDTCVPISKCPCYYKGSYLEPGQYVTKDEERCVCRNAKIQCTSVTIRMRSATECSSNKTYFNCSASQEQTSQMPVQLSCHTPQMHYLQAECVSGCVCSKGLYDDGKGGCVEQKDCPCVHNSQWYSPGQKITVDCNNCTCQNGLWNCTEDMCYGTCMIYGSGHYITFDGKFYDFDGSCEYVATQDFCGDKNSSGLFSIITENVPCGTTGVTCSKAIKMFLGKTELKLENKDYKEIQRDVGDDVQYWNRTVGLYLVIEASNGVMLIWDKKTTLFIKLSPDYKGKVCGLCGNFDDKSNNDFTTRSGLQETSGLKFGNSWKQSSMCPDVTQEIKPCEVKQHRKSWAEKECSIIRSEVFEICHSKVDPRPFYDACVHDACSCDSGGDCECFCSAVAAYAQECIKAQACVFWRTPDICPIFCDYYNPRNECDWHYEPCGSNITTCRMINNVSTNFSVPYLEGCYPRCPKDKPVYNEETKKCVSEDYCPCYVNGIPFLPGNEIPTEENCTKCVCGLSGFINCTQVTGCPCFINGTRYEVNTTVGQIQDGNICIGYICAENGSIVVGSTYPCPTPGAPTTISTSSPTSTITTTVTTTSSPATSTPCFELICSWTEWFDVSNPDKDDGDYETYNKIRKEHGSKICEAPEKIECRAKDKPDVSLEELGQKVECNIAYGLICKNEEQDATIWRLCYNYEIRVNCCQQHPIPCGTSTPSPTPTATSTTTSTTVPITTTVRQTTAITTTPIPTPTITNEFTPSVTTPVTSTFSAPHSSTMSTVPAPSVSITTPTITPSEPLSSTSTTTMPTSSTPVTTTTVPGTSTPTPTTASTSMPTPTYTTTLTPPEGTSPASGTPTKTSTTVTPSGTALPTTRTTEVESTVSTVGTTVQQSTPSVSTSAPIVTTSGVTETGSTTKTTPFVSTSSSPSPQSTTLVTAPPSHETTTTGTRSPSTTAPTTTISTTTSGPPSTQPPSITTGTLTPGSTSAPIVTTSGVTETGSTTKTTPFVSTSSSPSPQSTTLVTAPPSHETTTTGTRSPSTTAPTTTISTTTSGPPSTQPPSITTGSLTPGSTSAPIVTTSGVTETGSTTKTTPFVSTSSSPSPQSTTRVTAPPSHETTTTGTRSPSTTAPTTTISTTTSGPPSTQPPSITTGSLTPGSTSAPIVTTSGVTETGSTTKTTPFVSTSSSPSPQSTTRVTAPPSHETTTTGTRSPTTASLTTTISTTTSGPPSTQPPSITTGSLTPGSTSTPIVTTSGVTETGSTTKTTPFVSTSSSPSPQSTTLVTAPPSHETTTTGTRSPSTTAPTTTISTTTSGPPSTQPPSITTGSLTPGSTSAPIVTTSGVTETGSTTKTTPFVSTSSSPSPQSTTRVTAPPSHETTTTRTRSPTTASPTTTISTTTSGPPSTQPPSITTGTLTPELTSTLIVTTSGVTETGSTTKTTPFVSTSSSPSPQSTTLVTAPPSHETTTTGTRSPSTTAPTTTISTTTSGPPSTQPPSITTGTLTPGSTSTPVTHTGCPCVWTDWIDVSYPNSSDRNSGDYETFGNILKNNPSWVCVKAVDISCRAQKFPYIPLANLGQKVQCNVNTGLICNNRDQVTGGIIPMPVCLNYEIRVCCLPDTLDCTRSTTTSTTTAPPPSATSTMSFPPISTTAPTPTPSEPPSSTATTTMPPGSTTSSTPWTTTTVSGTPAPTPITASTGSAPPIITKTALPPTSAPLKGTSPASGTPTKTSTTVTPSGTALPTTRTTEVESTVSTVGTTVQQSTPSVSTSAPIVTTSGVTETGSTTKTTPFVSTSSSPSPQSTTLVTAPPSHETTTTGTRSPSTTAPTTTISTTTSGPPSTQPPSITTGTLTPGSTSAPIVTTSGVTETGSTTKTTPFVSTSSSPSPQSTTLVTAPPSHETTTTGTRSPSTTAPTTTISTTTSGPPSTQPPSITTGTLTPGSTSAPIVTTSGVTETGSTTKTTPFVSTSSSPSPQSTTLVTAPPSHETTTTGTRSPSTTAPTTTISTTTSGPPSTQPPSITTGSLTPGSTSAPIVTTSGVTETGSTTKTTPFVSTSSSPSPQSTTRVTAPPSHETTTTGTRSPSTTAPTTTISTTTSGPPSTQPPSITTGSLTPGSTSAPIVTTSGVTETGSTTKTTPFVSTSSSPSPQSTTRVTAPPSHETTTTGTRSPTTASLTTTISTTTSGPPSTQPPSITTGSLTPGSTSTPIVTTSGVTETGSTTKTTPFVSTSSSPSPQSTTLVTAPPSHETTTTGTRSPSTTAPTTTISTTTSGPPSTQPPSITTGSLTPGSTSTPIVTTSGVTETGSTTKTTPFVSTSSSPSPQSTTRVTAPPSHETTTTRTRSPTTASPTTTISTTTSGPPSTQPPSITTGTLTPELTSTLIVTTSGVTETGSTTKTTPFVSTSSSPSPQSTTLVTAPPSHETTTTGTRSPSTTAPTTTISTTTSGPPSTQPPSITTGTLTPGSTSTPVTHTGCPCVWTDWIDVSYPNSSDRNSGDYETFGNILKNNPSWVCVKAVDISCRAQKFPYIPLANLGQKVQCNVNTGLICNNRDQVTGGIIPMPVCLNYEIRVCCLPDTPSPQSTTLVTAPPSHETTTTGTRSPTTASPTTTISTTTSGPPSTQPPSITTGSLTPGSTSTPIVTTSGVTETGSTTKTTPFVSTSSSPSPQSTTRVTAPPSHETTTTGTRSPTTASPTTTISTTTSGPPSTQPPSITTGSLTPGSTSTPIVTTSGVTETGSTTKTTPFVSTSSSPSPQSTTRVTAPPSHETTTTGTRSPSTTAPTTTISTTTSGPPSTQPPSITTGSLTPGSTSTPIVTTSGVTETGSTTKTTPFVSTSSSPSPQSTTLVTAPPSHETTTTGTRSPTTASPTTTISTTTSGPPSTQPPSITTGTLTPELTSTLIVTTSGVTETGSTTKTTPFVSTSSSPSPQSTTLVTAPPSHETTTTGTRSPSTTAPTTTISTTTSGPPSTQPPSITTGSLTPGSTSAPIVTTSGVTETGSTTKTTPFVSTSSSPSPQSTTRVTAPPSHETTTTRTRSPSTTAPTTTISTTTSGPPSTQPPSITTGSLTPGSTSTPIVTTSGVTETGSTTKTTPVGSTPSGSSPHSTSTNPMSVTTSATTPTASFTTTSGTTSSNFTAIAATTTTSEIVPPASTSTYGPTTTTSAVTIAGSSSYSTVTPFSASSSTKSPPPTPSGRNCSIFPNESYAPGQSWLLCNCTTAVCIEDNKIELFPIICKPPPKPTCANGLSPVQVIDEDQCCWHWECDCYCTGWGDPHYMTFDGLYYSYQGNCTYVLVEEINKTVDNFGVYIDNYHCDTRDVVSCPRTLIVRHETQEVRIATVKQNALQVEVTVNKQAVALPYKKFGLSIYESGINRVVEIPELKMNVTYNGLSFSIRMAYSRFGNNTHGQCGVCNNNTSDDCMLPNGNIAENCETMADHWQVVDPSKPQCSPGLNPTGPPTTTPKLPCKESSICELLLGSVFKPCHHVVRPEKYYAACVFDSCVLPNLDLECSSLQIYATTCADQNVCIDWRSHTNGVCSYKCPSDKEYRACGPIEVETCKSSQQNKTSTKRVEGCFCPNGTMLYDSGVDVCVKTCGCVGVDKIPREFGEKFTVNCQDCICLEGGNGIVCQPHECVKQHKTSCDGEGLYEVTEVNSEDSCCPIVTCKCNASLCTTKAPKCTLGFEVHSHIPSGQCCPVYQCVPKRVCVHQNAEFLPNSSVFVDKCQNCFCTNEVNISTQLNIISCEHIPCNTYCEPGYDHQPVKGECCGRCVQTKCVIHTANNSDFILSPGEFKNDPYDNCTIYSCVNIHNQLISSTSEITCPAFNEESCKPGTITFLPNGCCKTCVPLDSRTPCSVRQRKDFIAYKGCHSVDRVVMTECEGTCGTFSLYSAEANSMEHSCSCCRESRTTVREVELKCPIGHSISHKYVYVESCSCQDTECNISQSTELQNAEENDKASTLNRIKRAISLTLK